MTEEYAASLSGDEVAVGDTGPEVVVEDLQRPDFVKYAGASGDFNPIHYDEPHAKEAGYDSVFAQGMLTAGIASHMVTDWFGLANVTGFDVRFEAQVWPGDTVTARGEITDVERDGDVARVEADVVVENQDGEVVLSGGASADLPLA
ncbi:MAG: MaoC family dehydratase [Haloarculaceae archaeon]